MWLILTFVANSALSFLLGLAVAAVLGPAEFGRYGVASMAAVVTSTLLFDWLRLSTTRFVATHSNGSEPGLRAALDRGYAAGGVLLIGSVGCILLPGVDVGWSAATLLATAAVAATTGAFEYAAAISRAMFLNSAYARLVVLKNVLGLLSMVAAGWYFGSAVAALTAFALSTALATLSVAPVLRHQDASRGDRRQRLAAFARYGGPIVAANLAYQAIVLLNRIAATATLGFAEAGQLSLATDVTIRVFLSAGAALDVYLFQHAVRTGAEKGEAAARQAVARNMLIVTGTLLLGAVGFVGAMPSFTRLVVPAAFQTDFAALGAILTPGILAFCLIQFALSPIFQLAGRTSPIAWTALCALVCDAGLLFVWSAAPALRLAEPSVETLAAIHTASLLAAFAVALGFAIRSRDCWPSDRDWAGMLAAAFAAGGAIWPTQLIAWAPLGLAAAIVSGTLVFGAVLLACDVGGCRALMPALRTSLSRLAQGRNPRNSREALA